MALNFGDLLSGLAAGATGVEAGIANRRELERRARLDLIAQRLQDAELGNYQGLATHRAAQDAQDRADRTRADREFAAFITAHPELKDLPRDVAAKVYVERQRPESTGYTSMGVTPTGEAVVLNTKTGRPQVTNVKLGAKPAAGSAALTQKIRLGAQNAAEALDFIDRLVTTDPNADVRTVGTSLAEGASRLPLIGTALSGLTEPLAQLAMTPTQQIVQGAFGRFAHNAVGLLPGSRQSLVLFQNLLESYRPKSNESSEARAAKRAARRELAKRLHAIGRGEDVTLTDLPGMEGFDLSGTGTSASPAEPGAPTPKNPFAPGGQYHVP